MNPKLRTPLIARLKQFTGQPYDVSACGLKESEIAYFSMSIWGTLDGSGWVAGKIENDSPSCHAGLSVMTNPNAQESTKKAAQSLVDGLVEIGLLPPKSSVGTIPPSPAGPRSPGTWVLESSGIDSVLVVIGTHP